MRTVVEKNFSIMDSRLYIGYYDYIEAIQCWY